MTNHLWQSTAFAALIALLALALRNNRASLRHWLWFAASLKFLIPLAPLMSLGRQIQPSAPLLPPAVSSAARQAATPLPDIITFTPSPERFDWTPWILAAWALGAFVILAIRLRDGLRIRALVRASVPLNLSLPVATRTSTGLLEPGIVGIWSPVLLLPAGLDGHLTPQQFDTVIAHELAHVRRRDNLLSAIHMLVETVFWFHPLVWWIGARLVEERENACDEAVVAEGRDPRDYADAIVNVCKRYLESPLACVSGVTGADLKKRIESIMLHRAGIRLHFGKRLLLAASALIAILIPFLAGIANAQSFEVASVRLKGPEPAFVEIAGDRFADTATVLAMIARGFRLPACGAVFRGGECAQISGGPDWIRKDQYRIQAKLPPGTPSFKSGDYIEGRADAVYAMIGSLLRERFQLKVHREMREVQVFLLSVDRGGHKMKPAQIEMVTSPDGSSVASRRFVFSPFADGAMFRLNVRNWSMQDAGYVLSNILDRPVLDRTGLAGNFDFTMEFAADRDNPGVRTELTGPELFTAFREQAGLRLESAREPVEVVVIDSIERPSEN